MTPALALVVGLVVAPAEWTPGNTAAEVTLAALTVVDLTATHQLVQRQDMTEMNPLLGRRPGPWRLAAAGAGMLAGHALVAYLLPPPWREYWQAAGIGIEASLAAVNVGFCARFVW